MAFILGEPTVQQYFDVSGIPLSGGTIEFYVWDTSTPAAVYSDSSGTSLGGSVSLNGIGAPQNSGGTSVALFFDTDTTYKIIRKDSSGETISPSIGPYRVFPDIGVIKSIDSISDLILDDDLGSFNQVDISSYYEVTYPSADGPKGKVSVHRTGATNLVPSFGSAVSVSTIGTGAQSGYFWDASGDEWKIDSLQSASTEVFGVTSNGSTDDHDAMQSALDAGEKTDSKTIRIPSGTIKTQTLELNPNFQSSVVGSGSSHSILSFNHSDNSQCLHVTALAKDSYYPTLSDFKIQGGASVGHGLYFETTGVGPQVNNLWIRDCSGSDKAGIRLENSFIGVVDNVKLFSNDIGMDMVRAKGIIGRGHWNADNDIGIRLDDQCNGNDLEMIELGVSSVDDAKIAIDCNGFSNRFKAQFYENYSSPRAIDFGPLSYGNILELVNASTLSIWDDGHFNQYPVTNHAQIQNVTTGFGFCGPLISGGESLENQYYDSSWKGGNSSLRWNVFGATGPTRSFDDTQGYLDNNSLKLDWGTTALSGVESAQSWAVSEGDLVSAMLMIRADRNLEATEQIVFKVHGAGNENREVQFKSDLRAGEWTPIFLTYRATTTENVNLNLTLDAESTHTALVTWIDDVVFQINKKRIGLLKNDSTSSTKTFSKNSGVYIPKAQLNQATLDVGSNTAAIPAILYVSTSSASTTGTSEEALVNHNIPAHALHKDRMGIKIKAWGTTSGNGNSKQIRVRFGGISGSIVADTGSKNASGKTWTIEATIIRTGNSAQVFMGESVHDDAISPPTSGTDSEDLLTDTTLTVSGITPSSSGDVTYLGSIVEIITAV